MANINLRDKAQQRDIDGVNYEVWPLPLGLAQTILLKFVRATGAAAAARLRTSADADVVTGLTVGIAGSGADVILDSTSISSGQNVTIAANPTLTHA